MIQITNVNKRVGITINSKDIKRITNGTIMNNILTIFMKIDKFLERHKLSRTYSRRNR